MNKAKELRTTTDLVKHILETVPATRNSDTLLYYRVCDAIDSKSLGLSFGYVLLSMNELKLPGFETVRRSRQKIQQAHPELAGKEVEGHRMINEEIFREYARGKV
jgi:hypothetical protein